MVPTKTYRERVVVSILKRGTNAVDKAVHVLNIRNVTRSATRSTTRSVKSKDQPKVAAAVKNLPAQKHGPQSQPNILLAPSLLPWHQKI